MAPTTSTAATRASTHHRAGALDSLRTKVLGAELGPTLAGTVLPFTLVLYLALRGGGYDAVVRSEVGIAVWWIVLLGAIVGLVPWARFERRAWLAFGLLVAFAVWVALAISWSESAERTVDELARVSTYLGVFALALATLGRDGLQRVVRAVAAALAVVACLALLSRLHPAWFPTNEAAAAFEDGEARLNYPVNYWNALAAMMAIAAPLLLVIAVTSRRVFTRALTTAVIPIVGLTAFYTFSRAGAIEIAVAVAACVALYPRRLEMIPTLVLSVGGGGLLIAAAAQRDALKDGLATQNAAQQADEMIAAVLVVCAGVALLSAAVGLAGRHGLLSLPRPSRRATLAGALAVAGVVCVAALAAGAPAELGDRWEEFKQPVGPEGGNTAVRLESASGNGRYQYWETAVEAMSTAPLNGIGPGTYEYFWDREGPIPSFVRDAHSLFLETGAELGLVGLLLLLGFLGWVMAAGIRGSFAAAGATRPYFAAATAAFAAFIVAAAGDWVWEVAVIPVTFLLLAAAVLRADDRDSRAGPSGGRARIAIGALAIAGTAAIALPLLGMHSVRASRANVDAGRLPAALSDAEEAGSRQPWAATPDLQQAQVLELQGELDAAAQKARAATDDEPTNWQTWYVLWRIEDARGESAAAADAYEEARRLNPRSPLFSD